MGWLALTQAFDEAVDRWDGRVGPPSPENRKTASIPVFRNAFVERFLARSHPILPGVWFGPPIVAGLAIGIHASPAWGLSLFAIGLLAWTLLEYVLHRFVFHHRPGSARSAKIRQFLMHGYHHEFPNDRMRLVAPPLMSWPIAAAVALGYRLVLGPIGWWPAFAGTAAGYLAYDWVHYYTHHFVPQWALGKYLRRIHLVHHHADADKNHGISSPLWDVVFGTYRAR
ncbi:MAG: sterol desaturase family protein [Myxococcota bacterium]